MSPWTEYKAKLAASPFALLNPNIEKASEEVAEARMAICMDCPELIKLTKQCKKCRMYYESKS